MTKCFPSGVVGGANYFVVLLVAVLLVPERVVLAGCLGKLRPLVEARDVDMLDLRSSGSRSHPLLDLELLFLHTLRKDVLRATYDVDQ
jgi:hypothetical protein